MSDLYTPAVINSLRTLMGFKALSLIHICLGAGAYMGEGTDLVVGADVAVIALAGVDGGACVHDGILQQGVGADDRCV